MSRLAKRLRVEGTRRDIERWRRASISEAADLIWAALRSRYARTDAACRRDLRINLEMVFLDGEIAGAERAAYVALRRRARRK